MPTPTPTPSQSRELNDLNSEKNSLQKKRNDLEIRQNLWHDAYLTLAIIAAAFGGLSWLFQHLESKGSRKERPINVRLSAIDDRIREIDKEVFDTALGQTWAIAATAEDHAQSEQLERERLEAQIAPRRLTLQQQKDIGHACLGITGKPMSIRSYSLDVEGTALGVQIVSSLRATGIDIRPNLSSISPFGSFDSGVVIHSSEEDNAFAACLGHALTNIGKLAVMVNGFMGLDGAIKPIPPLPTGTPIDIMVGVKPIEIESIQKNSASPVTARKR